MDRFEKSKIMVPHSKAQFISSIDNVIIFEIIEQINMINNKINNSCVCGLTPVEKKYFVEFLSGKTANQISKQYFRSRRTIEKHLENIKGKLNALTSVN